MVAMVVTMLASMTMAFWSLYTGGSRLMMAVSFFVFGFVTALLYSVVHIANNYNLTKIGGE